MPKMLGLGSSRSDGATGPTSFSTSTPGYSLSAGLGGGGSFSTSLTRTGSDAQTAFGTRFPRLMGDIDTLRGTLTPGYSALREAASREVSKIRTERIGNLRENLARRRILGSSFGEDALNRAEAEMGDLAARTQVQSFLAELDANMKVLGFEFEQIGAALERELKELGITSNFAANMGQIISGNQQFAQKVAAEEAAGRAKFFGTLAGLGVAVATGNPAAGAAASGAISGGGGPMTYSGTGGGSYWASQPGGSYLNL